MQIYCRISSDEAKSGGNYAHFGVTGFDSRQPKDDTHDDYPALTEALFAYISQDPSITVFDSDKYSQYMVYTHGRNGSKLTKQSIFNLGVEVAENRIIPKKLLQSKKTLIFFKALFFKIYDLIG